MNKNVIYLGFACTILLSCDSRSPTAQSEHARSLRETRGILNDLTGGIDIHVITHNDTRFLSLSMTNEQPIDIQTTRDYFASVPAAKAFIYAGQKRFDFQEGWKDGWGRDLFFEVRSLNNNEPPLFYYQTRSSGSNGIIADFDDLIYRSGLLLKIGSSNKFAMVGLRKDIIQDR